MCRPVERCEIGAQKSNFIRNVDPAKRGFKLEAIEGRQLAAESDYVATVKIAVTLSDFVTFPPALHPSGFTLI